MRDELISAHMRCRYWTNRTQPGAQSPPQKSLEAVGCVCGVV